jgi:hypothetical protein
MWFRDIPVERDAGSVRCASMKVWGAPALGSILSTFGLAAEPKFLREVPADKAKQVLAAILHQDMAYKSEAMPLARAMQLAQDFLSSHESGARFFINADWSEYFAPKNGPSSFSWNGLTEATFDAGVVAIDQSIASCVWVEDED